MTSPYLERRTRTYREALNDTTAKLPTLQERERLEKIDGVRERGSNIISQFEFYRDEEGLRTHMMEAQQALARLK